MPSTLSVPRGQTQKNVNKTVLGYLFNKFSKSPPLKFIDLPAGEMEFLKCMKQLFPQHELHGADIADITPLPGIRLWQMDFNRDFTIPEEEKFDVITSISGVMMFNHTQGFIENCTRRLKQGGTFVLTNDNSATIIDRLSFLLLGRYRMFKAVYEDDELVTEIIPIPELIRQLRKNGITIEGVQYTSLYPRDLLFLPLALLVYPLQLLYLARLNTGVPAKLKWQMYPFKHLFCKHYVIYGTKQ